jgi:uncharacterized protein (DUF39 family)
MMRRYAMLSAAMIVVQPAIAQTAEVMGPAETIAAVAAAPKGEVQGVFEMIVASTGASGFSAYLNSAEDYRDPGNLTIELNTTARNALKAKLGGHAEDMLKGKRVRVKGIARRVPVGSHFQTRIAVDTIDQIEILG